MLLIAKTYNAIPIFYLDAASPELHNGKPFMPRKHCNKHEQIKLIRYIESIDADISLVCEVNRF